MLSRSILPNRISYLKRVKIFRRVFRTKSFLRIRWSLKLLLESFVAILFLSQFWNTLLSYSILYIQWKMTRIEISNISTTTFQQLNQFLISFIFFQLQSLAAFQCLSYFLHFFLNQQILVFLLFDPYLLQVYLFLHVLIRLF